MKHIQIFAHHILIDDVRFRRILGMSETISAWNWPNIQTLQAVKSTLSDRIERLKIDILDKEQKLGPMPLMLKHSKS